MDKECAGFSFCVSIQFRFYCKKNDSKHKYDFILYKKIYDLYNYIYLKEKRLEFFFVLCIRLKNK